MITVDVVCYKYKPLKNGELPLKIKVCKDRKTRYINLGVSTRQEFWDFENNSAHVLGKADDFSVDGMSAEEARQKIFENIDRLPHPIRMENGVAWLHIDVLEQYGIDEKIYLFNQ